MKLILLFIFAVSINLCAVNIDKKNVDIKENLLYYFNGTTNKVTGTVIGKWENGKTKEILHIVNGELTGTSKCWYKNGQLFMESIYIKNKISELFLWYPSGKVKGYIKIKNKNQAIASSFWSKTGKRIPIKQLDASGILLLEKIDENKIMCPDKIMRPGKYNINDRTLYEINKRSFYKSKELANNGDISSQYKVGIAYYGGLGVEENKQKGFKWIKKAAKEGYTKAQFYLGICYYSGNGVEKNQEEAKKWIKKAIKNGSKDAAKYWDAKKW